MQIEQKIKEEIMSIWGVPENSEFLDMTPFGDFFVKSSAGKYFLYSLTNGEIEDVSELIEEHGLPPVSIELGEEWYQLDAHAVLLEEGLVLDDNQCFGFKQPIFMGGEYSPDNIEVVDIASYSRAVHKLVEQVKKASESTD